MFIYRFTNSKTNESYIGKWQGNLSRFYRRYNEPNQFDTNSKFVNAIRKYGLNWFKFEILKDNIQDKEELKNLEKYFIALYNTFNGFGYNMTEGGDGGCGNFGKNKGMKYGPKSYITKQKMSNWQQNGNAYWCGKTQSEEHKKKKSEAQKRKFTNEEINKITFLYCKGVSGQQIAKELGTCAVGRIIKEMISAGSLTSRYTANIIEENY